MFLLQLFGFGFGNIRFHPLPFRCMVPFNAFPHRPVVTDYHETAVFMPQRGYWCSAHKTLSILVQPARGPQAGLSDSINLSNLEKFASALEVDPGYLIVKE